MTAAYTHKNSPRRRLEQFFKDNPHEELTPEDVVVKFGFKNTKSLCTVMGQLAIEGAALETVRLIRRKR